MISTAKMTLFLIGLAGVIALHAWLIILFQYLRAKLAEDLSHKIIKHMVIIEYFLFILLILVQFFYPYDYDFSSGGGYYGKELLGVSRKKKIIKQ
jgi:hypothetical protein